MSRFHSISERLGGPELTCLRRHLDGRELSGAELLAHVDEHRQAVRRAWRRDPLVNVELSDRIADALVVLVGRVHEGSPPHLRGLVQAAVLYYCGADDAADDVQTAFGFDDDWNVVRAVEQVLDAA